MSVGLIYTENEVSSVGDPDPDPLVRGTDRGNRIRTKMSRIPNTKKGDSFTNIRTQLLL